jgi:hypothetical protein
MIPLLHGCPQVYLRVYAGVEMVELVEVSNADSFKGSASHQFAEAGEGLREYPGVELVEIVEFVPRFMAEKLHPVTPTPKVDTFKFPPHPTHRSTRSFLSA